MLLLMSGVFLGSTEAGFFKKLVSFNPGFESISAILDRKGNSKNW